MSIRVLITGVLGCVLISATSLYTAIHLGALPWPLFFAALVSFTILKRKNQPPDFNQINISHTIMTAGSMIAGAVGFTLPAIYLINPAAEIPLHQIFSVIIAASILGLTGSWFLRKIVLEKIVLPFPIGVSTAQTLFACVQKGAHSTLLLFSTLIAAIFVFLRDGFQKIPVMLFRNNFYFSPMAIGLGYLLKGSGLFWAGSGLLIHLGVLPSLLKSGFFSNATEILAWKKSLSMGMMISCGIFHLIISIWKNRATFWELLNQKQSSLPKKYVLGLGLPCLVAFLLLAFFSPLTILQSFVIIPVVLCIIFVSCILCGQTGINPLETLGIISFLFIALMLRFTNIQAVLLVVIGAVASGLCGDLMNDFQVGRIMKTPPRGMFIGEIIGALVGIVVTVLVFFALKSSVGSFGSTTLAVPQATALATIISGNMLKDVFVWGLLLGVGLAFIPHGLFLALGTYMPLAISTPIGLGSLLFCLTPQHKRNWGSLVATGFLAGEGIAGTSLAIWNMTRVRF